MSSRTREIPEAWAKDKLSEHADIVHGNTMFIFEARHSAWEKLREIDDLFIRLLTDPPKQLPSFLLFLAHSAYRAAVLLATGGHLTEAYAVLRSCLEDVLYAAFIGIDEERFKRWAARHDDDESLKAMKNEFRIGDIITALREKAPRIATLAQALYDRTIDLGGHPNPMALFSRLHEEKEKGTFRLDYHAEKDSVPLQLVIKTTAQVGVCCLGIAQLLFSERFKLTGLTEALDKARKGL